MLRFLYQLGNNGRAGTRLVGGGVASASAAGSHVALCRSNESADSESSYIVVEREAAAKAGLEGTTVEKAGLEGTTVEASEPSRFNRALILDDNRAEHGITSAIEIVSRRSRIRDDLLSVTTSAYERDRAWEKVLIGVREVLSQPEIMVKMVAVVRSMKSDKLDNDIQSLLSDSDSTYSVSDIDIDTDSLDDTEKTPRKNESNNLFASRPLEIFHTSALQWDELVAYHQCMICKDLLAAPVITGCSHSFCGMCLTNHMESIYSKDIEVIHPCPVCDEHIVNETYEAILDEAIARDVHRIPSCTAKQNWIRRRNDYHLEKKRANKRVNHELDLAIQCAIPVVAFLVIVCFVCL